MKDKRQNILFLFADQHRADWLTPSISAMYSEDFPKLNLPSLQRLQNGGMTFVNAFSPSPLCAPARACLACGCNYEQTQVKGNSINLPSDSKTFYKRLRDSGYEVMGVGKFDLHKADRFWGKEGMLPFHSEIGFTRTIDSEGKYDSITKLEENSEEESIITLSDCERGPYMTYLKSVGYAEKYIDDIALRRGKPRYGGICPLPNEHYADNWIASNAIKFINEADEDKPWFMQVNFNGPHDPWDVTESMYESVREREFPAPVQGDKACVSEDSEVRKRYCSMIENIDRNVGLILSDLERKGELENTLVIYAADHGEMLGDFGRFGKKIWRHASMNVPLMFFGKGVKDGVVNKATVQLQDVAKTVLDFAQVEAELPDSKSLKEELSAPTGTHRAYAASALNGWQAVVADGYKYVVDGGVEMLFDLKNDYNEERNVIAENEDLAKKLSEKLASSQKQ